MTIYDQKNTPIAVTTTRAVGREFLLGICTMSAIPGWLFTMNPDTFVLADFQGRLHVIEDYGDDWIFHRVVHSGAHGFALTGESVRAAKESEVGA